MDWIVQRHFGSKPFYPDCAAMDAAGAKRRKICYFKGVDTANPALWAAGWRLDLMKTHKC